MFDRLCVLGNAAHLFRESYTTVVHLGSLNKSQHGLTNPGRSWNSCVCLGPSLAGPEAKGREKTFPSEPPLLPLLPNNSLPPYPLPLLLQWFPHPSSEQQEAGIRSCACLGFRFSKKRNSYLGRFMKSVLFPSR